MRSGFPLRARSRVVLLTRLCVAGALLCAAGAVFFLAKVRERDRLLDALIAQSTRGIPRQSVDAVAEAIARRVYLQTNSGIRSSALPLYDRLEATSFFNVSTGVALKHGIYGVMGQPQYGPCGTMTRVVLNALWRMGIPARKLLLLNGPDGTGGGHALLEYRSGGRWAVLSPANDGFTWRNAAGRPATLEEIRTEPGVFEQIFAREPSFPYRFYNAAHIRWEKLPPPVRLVFRVLLGESGYRNAQTPELYDQPRHLFLFACMAGLVLFTLLGLLGVHARRMQGATNF